MLDQCHVHVHVCGCYTPLRMHGASSQGKITFNRMINDLISRIQSLYSSREDCVNRKNNIGLTPLIQVRVLLYNYIVLQYNNK